MQRKNIYLNLIVSFITQLITLLLGMIVPRLVLITWGSEYNGLLSSVTNILRYLSLLEAGFNTSTLQALYKAIAKEDEEQISIIVCTSQKYYHKISLIYALIVCIIAFLYPLLITSEIPYWEIVLIIIFQGAVGVINFAFRASYQQLLNAEGKYYFISLVTLLTTILSYVVKIISVLVFNSVIIMQALSVVVIIFQVSIYTVYFNKRYKWINKNVEPNPILLENRKYYFTQQIAGLVFNSTDTFLLSIFCGLKVASVYAVYNLVYSALHTFISIIRNSTNFVLGQSYHQDKNKFYKIYYVYSSMQATIGGILSSVSIIMIIDFIHLYTRGIYDIDYIDFLAAFLFSFNLILECSRGASLAAANIAGKAPETTSHYIAEAAINLISSLILVNIIGMKGVLLGTSIAGLYRTTDSVIYTNNKVLGKSPSSELGMISIVFGLFFVAAYVSNFVLNLNANSYIQLIINAIIPTICVFIVYSITFLIYNKNEVSLFCKEFKKR